MAKNVALPLARKIEIGVVGQVEDCVFVGGRRIFNVQSTPTQGVAHRSGECAGKTLIAILAHVSQFDSIRNLFAFPHNLVEPTGSPVQGIVTVVLWNGISLAVKLEGAVRNAVRVAADDAAEMRSLRLVLLNRVDTQDNVVQLAISIRRAQ